MEIEKVLGREQWVDLLDISIDGATVLITGASGSVGRRLAERLLNCDLTLTDVIDTQNYLDVTDISSIRPYTSKKYDYVINLAGMKHAPKGEEDTYETLNINTIGTSNLIKCFPSSKIILTSTCKSCNPETVYGASKLIAERMVLNSGNSVARFYNVIQSSGNVFEIWDKQKTKEVASLCERYFVSMDEAVGLIIHTMKSSQGRYSVNPKKARRMNKVFNAVYGDKPYRLIEPRRGDRLIELKHSTSEWVEEEQLNGSILKIQSSHDAN